MLALAVRLMIAVVVIGACATPGRIQPPVLSTSTLAAAHPVTAAPPALVEGITKSSPAGSGDSIWTIKRGSYAGKSLALSYDSALGNGRDPEHFWRLPESGNDGVVGWSTERFPIPVAFRRGGRSSGISAGDSAAFWGIIREMESDLGRQVFRPATVAHAADPEDVIIVDVRLIEGIDGVSRLTWKPSGELFDVRITFRETATLRDEAVVMHEMMHALGFGHTKAWRSVVNPSPYVRLRRLSPEDVAYAEVGMGLRTKHEQSEMRQLARLAVEQEPRNADLLSELGADELDWSTGVFNDEAVPICAHIPPDLIAAVQQCGRGLR